ncbi:hypothetical protein LCM17_23135 [Cereibacter sphaeroides]|nr:hypothetical protein [Cereibacter sphaeroides]
MLNTQQPQLIDRLGAGTGLTRRIRWCLLKRDYYARRCVFRSCRSAA